MTPERMAAVVKKLREYDHQQFLPNNMELVAFAAAALEKLCAHADAEDWGETEYGAPTWYGDGVPWEAFEAVLIQYAEPLADAVGMEEGEMG